MDKLLQSIFIETNENDYMSYFEDAARCIGDELKNYTNHPMFLNAESGNIYKNISKDIVSEIFLDLTSIFYKMRRREDLNFICKNGLKKDLEIFIGQDAIDKAREYEKNDLGNGSHILINC